MQNSESICRVLSQYIHHGSLRKTIKRVELATETEGPSGGMRELFEQRNTKIHTIWEGNKEKTRDIIRDQTKPVILASNHPHWIEPLVFLASLPPRKNMSMIGAAGIQYFFGEEIRKHYIPVYHGSKSESSEHKKERKEKNEVSIDKAIAKMQTGDAILIAPDGRDGTNIWKKGAVRLVESALNLPEAYVVMAHISDSTSLEFMNLIFKKKIERTVRISSPLHVKDLPLPEEIKALPMGDKTKLFAFSDHLTNHYNRWAGQTDEDMQSLPL